MSLRGQRSFSVTIFSIERANPPGNSAKHFGQSCNEALRAGLERIGDVSGRRPYRTVPHDMGLREGLSPDNVQELLSQLEGDDGW